MKKKRTRWQVKLRRSNYNVHKENEFVAQVVLAGSYKLDDVIARITASGGNGLSRETLRDAAGQLMDGIIDCLMDGIAVNLPIGRLTPAVSGVWQTKRRFDSTVRAQNEAFINYSMSPRLRKALADPLLDEVSKSGGRRLYILGVEDINSKTKNERLTPGGMLIVHGSMLLMNGDLPERGLYYLNAETGATVCHIPAEQLSINTRSEIITIVPKDLPAGRYRLRIVSQCTTSPRPMKQAASYTMKGEMVCGEEAKQP